MPNDGASWSTSSPDDDGVAIAAGSTRGWRRILARADGVSGATLGWVAVGAVAIAAVAFVTLQARPSGHGSASAAVLAETVLRTNVEAKDVTVLREVPWGDGALVIVGFDEPEAGRRLGLAFAIDRGRGWRVPRYSDERAEITDVVGLASLLVVSSDEGDGQPAWSAAYGEVGDDRVAGVEIQWSDGESETGALTHGAYLLVREGELTALQARYLDAEGDEVAPPVSIEVTS